MDEKSRLKIKIGPHEFEAEGSPEMVQEQFRVFKEMVETAPTPSAAYSQSVAETAPSTPRSNVESTEEENVNNSLHKIMDSVGSTLSLTVRPSSVDDATLLILLGQKWTLGNDTVTGGMVMSGITETGGFSVKRVDRVLEKLGREGSVIVLGEHRSKRYRLTNAGITKAKLIADELIALVP